MQFSPAQRQTLEAVVRVFAHADPPLSAPHLQARVEAIRAMVGATTTAEQADFLRLLDILGGRMATWMYAGRPQPFHSLPPERQIRLLQAWSGSMFGLFRKAFSTLKKLSLFTHYGSPGAPWDLMKYPGPLQRPPLSRQPRLQTLLPADSEVIECDTVVVGSGAGGGIAAGILAEAGHDVLIVEKGPYMEGADFSDHEADMIRATHDRQGAFTTRDGGVGIFAGSCLGGGTTINWTGSFPTPGHVREEWQRDEGLGFALGADYDRHLAEVMASIHANDQHSHRNPQNQHLWDGAEKLGRNPQLIHRNVEGCTGDGLAPCGYCGMGCRQGHKRGTLSTWIRRAAARGARIVVNAEAERITQAQGHVTGLSLRIDVPGEAPRHVTVRARRVVLAAGALQSPALLLRSGLSHPGIGRNLFFHPTVAVAGFYDQPSNPWHGPMMTTIDRHGMLLDGNHGYWIETPPVHLGLAALALPWEHPALHRADMARVQHMATFIVLTRDRHGGRITVNRSGQARADYTLHPYDRQHMLAGIRAAYDIHAAAGAHEVVFPHQRWSRYRLRTSKRSPQDFLGGMAHWGWAPNRFALFTAHQMGTCGMGGDNGRHPFDPEGQSRELKGLYIADGSALPTSAGVNPMVSIMALAGWVAKGMA